MNKLIIALVILLAAGCKEKFLSPVSPVVNGFLVVEGVINNGGGETNLRLSRTVSLDDNNMVTEPGATVKIESSNSTFYSLPGDNNGNYSINNLYLDTSLQYRLSVKTSNNEEFVSEYVKIRNNPPVDSINWVRQNDGVQLYINTHNPENDTRYYQWDYKETWEFHSGFFASLKYIKGPAPTYANIGVAYRDASDPQIYTCWKYNTSNSILIGSSAKLSQDIIHLPISFIENASQKLSVQYSILVNQYAWSKEGYDFLERMKKNTESLGSVFDAQPSELNGNIRCITNPDQPVIGFFNICTIQQKRIFIKIAEVPGWGYRTGCREIIIENEQDSIFKKASGLLPTTVEKASGPFTIVTFYASDADCVDCTMTGSNIKPVYWP